MKYLIGVIPAEAGIQSWRKWDKLIFIMSLIFVFSGCVKQEAVQKEPIKIGLNIWPGYAYAFIAREKGFFKQHNVEVELILKESVTEATELYRYNEVDGLFTVMPDVVMLCSEGIPSKLIYVTDYSNKGDVIVGRPEFDSLAELRGKTVGFEGVNTFSHMFVLEALTEAGIKESEVRFKNLSARHVLTALEKREIDAGHTWEPVITHSLEKGYKVLVEAGQVAHIITDVLVFNPQVIEARPGDIKSIIRALAKARNFVFTNKEEALKIMAKAEIMDIDEMRRGIAGVHLLDLKDNVEAMQKTESIKSLHNIGEVIIEFLLNRGQLLTIPDCEEIIEPRFVNELYIEKVKGQEVMDK
jgi:NitT/TauT family transport system substrate-binding protein